MNKTHHWKEQTRFSKCTNFQSHGPKYHSGKDSASYRLWRNKVQREVKSAKHYYYKHKVCDLEQSNGKKWWKQIKCLTGQDIQQEWFHQFLDDNCPDTKSLADKVNDFFLSLREGFAPLPYSEPTTQFVPPELLVTEKEVLDSLSSLKVAKAIGPDKIPNKVLKEFAPELAPVIKNIYNRSMKEGYVPELLKCSIVNPVPKVSPPQHIESDLRPISLTCTLAKVISGRFYTKQTHRANCKEPRPPTVCSGGPFHDGCLNLPPTSDSRSH